MQQQTVRAYRIKNEAETRAFALALADKLQAGDVLALIGELGTGKTALTRFPMAARFRSKWGTS